MEHFIWPNIKDIPLVELTKAKKEAIKAAERVAINTVNYTRQPIPHFPNKTDGGNYLSLNQALSSEVPLESLKKPKRKKETRQTFRRPRRMSVKYQFELADEPTDLE